MKKFILIILFAIITLVSYSTTYYVKNGGSDAANGLTDGTAWATIAKVNATISAGDIVYFKRGSTWRNEQINPVAGTSGGNTTYGAYGTGADPLILGSLTANGGWTNLGSNIWQTTGWAKDIGNIIFNNETSCGIKLASSSGLNVQGEFWYDYVNDLVRMYSTSNPATYYTNIEFAISQDAVITSSDRPYITIEDLDFRYWGQCVIQNARNYSIFRRLNLKYIGGADVAQMNGGTWYETRWGNGLQAWQSDGHHVTFESNKISECYDAGLSPQGQSGSWVMHDIIIRNNIVTNCEYNLEFWLRGSNAYNIWIEHNVFAYAGYGWAHNQRWDNAQGHNLANGGMSSPRTDIYIRNNIFYYSMDNCISFFFYNDGDYDDLKDIIWDYNLYWVPGQNIGYSDAHDDAFPTFADWQAAVGVDEDMGIGADPLFVDPTNGDFHLQSTSPAKNQGLAVAGVTTDHDGVAWISPPSIGAYEVTAAATPVSSITVSGTGGATTITVDNGTLQMLAAILPVDATIQTVTWSVVSGGSLGSISSSGLLTAIDNGSVTVRATANDGSGVYDDQVIVMSNQVVDVLTADYYVSPTGSDSNPGTIAQPFLTLNKAWSLITSGGLIYMRGGTYSWGATVTTLNSKSGTSGDLIKIWAYPGEEPVIDYNGVTFANDVNAINMTSSDYIHIKGIRVTRLLQESGYDINRALILWNGVDNCIFEELEFDHIGGVGMTIGDNSSNNLFLNCDSHHNSDQYSPSPYGGGDGFQSSSATSTNNTFSGCRAWANSDDGFDLRLCDGIYIITNSWSFWNGYIPSSVDNGTWVVGGNGTGFKLGQKRSPYSVSILRSVTNCVAFENRIEGFDLHAGDNDATAPVQLLNCTGYRNGINLLMDTYTKYDVIRNCIMYAGRSFDYSSFPALVAHDHNDIDLSIIETDADFISVTSTDIDAPRGLDGGLPDIDFLKLSATSDFIDVGADVGITYSGDAPDLGAFEFSEVGSATLATVTTTIPYSKTTTGAMSGGNVIDDGYAAVTAKGICWATTANPVSTGNHYDSGTGTGSFTGVISGLTKNTTYHVRAWATNSVGTSYGADITFKTPGNLIVVY